MRAVVIGAGPIGTFSAMALSRRGHDVVLVDRDPGPAADGSWRRMGVMQFMHPHFFRPAVRQALLTELPDVWDALLAAGGEPRLLPGQPETMTGLACRRLVFERTLRAAAIREPGVLLRVGHADRIVVADGAARGVLVDDELVPADLVVVATGRASRLGEEFRGAVEGGSCGFSYVSRMYRARPGQPGCDLPVPTPVLADGYVSLIVPQDDGTLSALISRPTADPRLLGVRHEAGFDAAARAIPNLAPWTDPERFEPITDVLVGGGLTNTYRYQGPERGTPPATGLFFLGDAVCTTNPRAGRGIALGLRQAQHLLTLLDDSALDLDDASRALDAWSDENIRPWFRDHAEVDAAMLRRFAGQDVALEERIPSDVVCAAAEVELELMSVVGPYLAMVRGPEVLDAVEERVRSLLRAGWRPAHGGPSAADLADAVGAATGELVAAC
jgi:2-polyprenyl-6-methoxyphenol hydroxylase-like FAD-dependent oxidoreductase